MQEFANEEIELMRQWFDAVHDMNPQFLEAADFALAKKIYEAVGMRVPNCMRNRVEG